MLKGMIAIATCLFPTGTSGAQIDAFARAACGATGSASTMAPATASLLSVRP
ncbi:MAG: hypothetical protein U1E17_02945 [Geminicoccaceae bacterium]